MGKNVPLYAVLTLVCAFVVAIGLPPSSMHTEHGSRVTAQDGSRTTLFVSAIAGSLKLGEARTGDPSRGVARALAYHVANVDELSKYADFSQPLQRDGYAKPGDGGAGYYYYVAAACKQPDGGAEVPASNGNCWHADLSHGASLRLWGAAGNGKADDSASVRAALAVANVKITDPTGGIYALNCASGPFVFGAATTFAGAGRQATMFRVTSSDCPVFLLGSYYNAMRHFSIQAYTTQKVGSIYVIMSGIQNVVEDYAMTSDYTAVLMSGSTPRLGNGNLRSPSKGAIRVRVEGGDTSPTIDGLVEGADTNSGAAVGIRVRNSSALTISNTSLLSQNNCLQIDPYAATPSAKASDAGNVFDVTVNDSFFDNCENGVVIAPSGTGSVLRTRFVNSWTSSAVMNGFSVNNLGSGSIRGIYVVNHHAVFNTNGSGLTAAGKRISDIQINGGAFGQNKIGLDFEGVVSGIGVHGASIGQALDASGNTNCGIFLGPDSEYINITDNILLGNMRQIIDATPGSAIKIISNNTGYNPLPRSTMHCSSSPCTVGNSTGAPLQVLIVGGTVTALAEDGIGIPSSTAMIILPQGSSITISYTHSPTIFKKGL